MSDDAAPVDPYTLTPTEAGAKLAEIAAVQRGPAPSATPTTPAEASARLRAVTSDPKWSERYMAGAVAERREFEALTQLVASGGESPDFNLITTTDALTDRHAVSPAAYNGLIDGLRAQGLPISAEAYARDLDAGVRTDRPTAGDGVACRQARDRLLKSAEFRQRVLDGDVAANNMRNTLDRIVAYAADDGLPASEYVQQQLAALGLR